MKRKLRAKKAPPKPPVSKSNPVADLRKTVDSLEKYALSQALKRAKAGKDLTPGDRRLIEKFKARNDPPKVPASRAEYMRNRRAAAKGDAAPPPQSGRSANVVSLGVVPAGETWVQRLKRLKESCIAAIEFGVVNEKGNARAAFAKMGLELADQLIDVQAESVQVRFDPIGEESEEKTA